ncbi:protein of unknown function [Candidatus Filomicrobium marinum]|nr:protein of unknown function [Candidatus Filomicrobium marinum]
MRRMHYPFALSRNRQQFRAIFEVHGVEVVPFSAPYEAMTFEDLDDFVWNSVAVPWGRTAGRLCPAPIIRMLYGDVDGDAVTVRRDAIGPGDNTAIVRSC